MAEGLDIKSFADALAWLKEWFFGSVYTADSAVQLGASAAACLLAVILTPAFRRIVDHVFEGRGDGSSMVAGARDVLRSLVHPMLWLTLQCALIAAAPHFEQPHELLRIVATLISAWIVIRVTSSAISDPFWSRTAAMIAWSVAALHAFHLLTPTVAFLDSLAMTLGEVRVSLYSLIKGIVLAGVLLWLALGLSNVLQTRIQRVPNLTPSIQVLIGHVVKFALVTTAIVVALGSVGIDLTAFAVFSGAVGVGVGFGLQKVVSNLISGIILLVDRSIKPGDVIEIADTYGWVGSLGARHVSVVTRDGTEHLIPNEDLITQPVINWSYSSNLVRRRVPIGVSYSSDIDLVTKLVLGAATDCERVLDDPAPKCLLRGFGDNSVDFELRFWITDPEDGVANVADEVLRKIWYAFQEHEIEIPFPQRDLHIRSAIPLVVGGDSHDST